MFCRLHHGPRTAVFPVEGNRANSALDNVAVHLDGAVVHEPLQAVHVF